MKNFSGVFLVLGVMIAFGLLVLIIEILISAWQESKEKGVSLWYINSWFYSYGNTLAILIQLLTLITGVETLNNGCNAGDSKLCPVRYIIFPRVILYNFFLFLLIYGDLGFRVLGLGSYFGFLGLELSVDGVWGLWCGAFWVFWVWALYINIKE